MQEREHDPHLIKKVVMAFFTTVILFVLVFSIANGISYYNYKSIVEKNNAVLQDIAEVELRLENFLCDNSLLAKSSRNLDSSGFKISILETRFGKYDERVLKVKKLYSQLEFSHFSLVNKFKEECGADISTILFFYSNDESVEEESEKTGFILGSFRKGNFESIMIYSFDINLDFELIRTLREEYNITHAPVIVVNEEEPFYLRNIDDLRNR